jgi:uncharacterized metal-binding protein
MALGSTHRKFNALTSVFFSAIVLVVSAGDWEAIGCFLIAFVLGTFILSPDVDLGPNKYSRWSKLFLYPYSLLFKHRGISHSIFFGTLTRIVYGVVLGYLLLVIGEKTIYQGEVSGEFISFFQQLFFNFSYSYWPHKWLLWFYSGLFCSDLSHVFLDSLSSRLKKLFK